MNRRLIYLNRAAGKIDAALSYVGGLLGIVAALLAFFVNNYNNYRY
jgi:glutamine synthetase